MCFLNAEGVRQRRRAQGANLQSLWGRVFVASAAVKLADGTHEECVGSPAAALQQEIGAVDCSHDLFDLSIRGPSGGD